MKPAICVGVLFSFLKDLHSFDSSVPSYFYEFRGVPDESGGKSIPVASIRKYVGVMLVRIIIQT